jgi:hypothetical protein
MLPKYIQRQHGYFKGIVFFIDILGTKNYDFEKLSFINNIFRNELEKITVQQEYYYKKIVSFSDCSYIIYTSDRCNIDYYNIKDKDLSSASKTVFYLFLEVCLYDISLIIALFVSYGFLCRGGISFGDLYFEEENNIIFGPSINEAYRLETISKMPRIIFDDILGDGLFKHLNSIRLDKPVFDFLLPVIKDNYDNMFFCNYLNYVSVPVFSKIKKREKSLNSSDFNEDISNSFTQYKQLRYDFKELYKYSLSISKNIINNTNDHNIIVKHKWQINYLERINSSFDKYYQHKNIVL